jgi:hypothetical protein
MHETPADIERLQALLDRGAALAGPCLKGVHAQGRRLPATELVDRLQGVSLRQRRGRGGV